MALIPTPRSYSNIVGDMSDAFLSRFGIPALKVGGPPLAVLESAAQSDLRNSQDIFQLLSADSLDRSEGTALDRTGADEELPRITESLSSGFVTVTDPNFSKLSSKIFAGLPAPIAGSSSIYVLNATLFPSTGSVYIGRGTTNYEGPLNYTAKTNLGTYWRLDLDVSSKTTRFHNQNETVVLAQGGNRLIQAGSICQTPQGNVSQAIQFRVLYSATIPDGETSISNVSVIALKPGILGNIPSGAIKSFSSAPFTGALVTNPLPFTNALPKESDKDYRERIRDNRASKALGTDLAITTNVLGITSPDEPKRVVSAVVVDRQGLPSTLYIDDGTGYEEQSTGIAQEILVDSAFGGENYFQIAADRPVTKAFLLSSIAAPFTLASGMVLAIKVGGILSKHTFDADEFQAITNATAYEVVASINGDPSLTWSARTLGSGTLVAIFAKTETGEDIEVVGVDNNEVDANEFLGYSVGRADTMRLYKNDLLLSKDGEEAIVESEAQANWGAMSGSQTLTLQVDDTPAVTYTFTDIDFINANTGYATLSIHNSLNAWATVFNKKIPGVLTTNTGGKLTLVSNLGANNRAAIIITGGTLVSSGKMFVFNTATGLQSLGKANDYTMDRNRGQLTLSNVLQAGDRLTIGTPNTRAFVQSNALATTTLASNGELWFIVDGGAQLIGSGIVSSSTVTLTAYATTPPETWGQRVRITASTAAFTNVQVGDWAIHLDTNLNTLNRGAWRVAYVDGAGFYYEIAKITSTPQAGVQMNGGGIVFARSIQQIQKIVIPAATNYTAATFVDSINTQIRGATAVVYNTNKIRVRTNTFGTEGDIALVAQNGPGAQLGMTPGNAVTNLSSHLAAVESGPAEDGTPDFFVTTVATSIAQNSFTATSIANGGSNSIVRFLRNLPDIDSAAPRSRYGTNNGFRSAASFPSGTTITTRLAALNEFIPQDRFYLANPSAMSAADDFTVLVDQDIEQKRYVVNMFRNTKPTNSTYGLTNALTDTDNGGASLALGFGTGFNFKDFAAYMHARIKSHSESGDTNKSVLWRYSRWGADGNTARVRYVYPTAPSLPVAVTTEPAPAGFEGTVRISVGLPSNSPRAGFTIRNTTKIGVMAATTGALETFTYLLGFSVTTASRNVVLNYTSRGTTAFTGTVTGGTSGATGTVVSDSLAGGLSGSGTLVLSNVTGNYTAETITGTTGSATAVFPQFGQTTLTLDIGTPGASNHGFNIGDQIWMQSTNVNFATGLFTLTAVTSSTVTYTENTNSVTATANPGTVSFDANGQATLQGSMVVANDIVSIGGGTSLPASYEIASRIGSLGNQFWKTLADSSTGTSTVPTWALVNDATQVQFFPINTGSSTAATVAAAVNALAAVANTTCPVTAVAVGLAGDTSGQITKASYDEFTTHNYGYNLTDGINWIDSHSTPPDTVTNYSFTFKNAISASLATNSDWQNEVVRLVPTKCKNLVDYLNVLAVSGLSSVAEVAQADDNNHVQIASDTLGSGGSVQVQGGTANSLTANVIGSAVNVAGGYQLVTVKKADVEGLSANMWVDVQNLLPMPKNVFSASTTAVSIDTSGNFVLGVTPAYFYANTGGAPLNGFTWQIEAQSRYTAFVWNGVGGSPDLTSVQEGDWVIISNNSETISSRNTGQYRIVRISDSQKTFWIENPNMAEEIVTADLRFLTYNSIMPGDTITIGTPLWGTGNQGSWTVKALNFGNTFGFQVDVSSKATAAFTGPVALGSQSSLVQCLESAATKLTKQVRSISTNPADGTLVDVKFSTFNGYANVGSVAGSMLVCLDKLDFPTTLAEGIDGYQHSTGLIAEANRILYGVKDDPATYPGIVASGSNVNQSGPLVKRITIAVAIRTRVTGVVVDEVKKRVKSAIASVINKSLQGQPIAIDEIVKAVKSVNGVIAGTILSPTYGVGNDLIPVQPFEKPLILNLDQDIQVSLVGE